MEKEHGSTEKISRGREERLTVSEREGLGTIPDNGSINGLEQVGISGPDSTGENSIGTSPISGDTPAGKILQRLELVENAHLEYVHAHQGRLEARLDESKEREAKFKEAVAELKQEIYRLATETDNNGNGNGKNGTN